jgi:hypothetical protein
VALMTRGVEQSRLDSVHQRQGSEKTDDCQRSLPAHERACSLSLNGHAASTRENRRLVAQVCTSPSSVDLCRRLTSMSWTRLGRSRGSDRTSSGLPQMTGDAPEQQQQQPSGTHLHVLTDQFGRTHLVREERGGFDGRPTFQIQPATDEAARAADEAARLEAAERRRPAKKGGAVVYEFRPRYPLVARAEDVVGALATSREVCAAMARLQQLEPSC